MGIDGGIARSRSIIRLNLPWTRILSLFIFSFQFSFFLGLSWLSVFWERGSPDLPACGPRRGSTSGLVRPIFISQHSRPSRGAKPRKADDARPPRGKPHQVGSRGSERSRQGAPREVPVTQTMTTGARRGARRAPACSVLVSSLVLKRQAQARSPKASGKGFHIGATRPRQAG